jgi:hypothetical protein
MNEQVTKAIKAMPAFPQRQDSTMDQLRDLERVAVKMGMYDASDLIRGMLQRHDAQVEKLEEASKIGPAGFGGSGG